MACTMGANNTKLSQAAVSTNTMCTEKYGQGEVLICEREPDRDIAEARRQPTLTHATWRELDSCSQNTQT